MSYEENKISDLIDEGLFKLMLKSQSLKERLIVAYDMSYILIEKDHLSEEENAAWWRSLTEEEQDKRHKDSYKWAEEITTITIKHLKQFEFDQTGQERPIKKSKTRSKVAERIRRRTPLETRLKVMLYAEYLLIKYKNEPTDSAIEIAKRFNTTLKWAEDMSKFIMKEIKKWQEDGEPGKEEDFKEIEL